MTLPALPLSPKQIASIVEAEDHRLTIWSGAVRAGKTIASIVAFFIAVKKAPDSGLILICGRTLQTIERNIIEPMQDPAIFGKLASAVQHTRGSSTATVLGRTVHLIGAADVRAEGKLRGLTACLAMVDEATLLPEEFFTQLLARLSVPGAKCYVTTNPGSPASYLKKKFIDRMNEPDMNLRVWNFMMDDNPSLSPEYIAATKAEFTGLFYMRNIEGRWVSAEGGVYDMFDHEKHIIPRGDLPQMQQLIACGIDVGATNPTAAVLLGLGVDNCLYIVDEWYRKPSSSEASWSDVRLSKALREWLAADHIPQTDLEPKYIIVDPAAKHFRDQLLEDGVKTVAAKNDVLEGIRTVSNLFSTEQLKISDHCHRLLEELPDYRWDPKATERGEDAVIKTNDHAVDAMRYATFTTRRRWKPYLKALPETDANDFDSDPHSKAIGKY